MKKYFAILLTVLAVLSVFGCAANSAAPAAPVATEAPEPAVFTGVILEISGDVLTVCPDKGTAAAGSADKIEVSLKDLDCGFEPAAGDTVKVFYSGEILETYPARVAKALKVELVSKAPAAEEPAPATQAPETPEAPATEAPEAAVAPVFTKEAYPKVDGATAMKPMDNQIAMALLGMTEDEADEFVVHNTTAQAYYNLIDGTADIIFVSEPSDDILQRAADAGVEFEMVGIGRDGFVFVINQENPVDSLTIEQIQDIYTGKITNWSEVGGEDTDILAYQREQNSGSQNLMEKMVMKGLEMADAPVELRIESMAGLIDSVAAYENCRASIGYSIYLYAKEQYVKDSIKFLSVNGVYPTDETIASGEYPLSKIVYAVLRKDEPEGCAARQLADWLLTDEGQQAVVAGGYTGIR